MTKTTAEKPKMLAPARLTDHGFGWRCFEATIPSDVPLDHLMSENFFRLCSRRIHRGDKIAWRTDSLLRCGELLVMAVDQATGRLELRELWSREFEPATTG